MYNFAPGLIILLACISFLFPLRIAKGVLLTILILALVETLGLKQENLWLFDQIHEFLQIKSFLNYSKYFATIILSAAILGVVYSLTEDKFGKREMFYCLIYVSVAIMCLFTKSFFYLFLYLEIMTISSVALIFVNDNPESESVGMRYLIIHILSGVLILTGLALVEPAYNLEIQDFASPIGIQNLKDIDIGKIFILAGLMINVAAPPFSAWIADSYPKVPSVAMIFLSSITTKVNIFILLNYFFGTVILMYFGAFMALYGMIYAILNDHINKALCYSLVAKLGVMLIWIGQGGAAAESAIIYLVISHILYNVTMIVCHSVIEEKTQSLQLFDLGGIFKSMGVLSYTYLIAILNLIYFPLTLSYFAKSYIVYDSNLIKFSMVASNIASAVFGLRMVYYIFFHRFLRKETFQVKITAKIVALCASAILMLLPLTLPIKININQLLQQIIILVTSMGIFWLFKAKVKPKKNIVSIPDMDIIYRKYFKDLILLLYLGIERLFEYKANTLKQATSFIINRIRLQVTQVHREGLSIRVGIRKFGVVAILVIVLMLSR